jgi:hypothetical protein
MGAGISSSSNGRKKKVTAAFSVYCHPELKELLAKHADNAGVPLSEYAVILLAKAVGRRDLAAVPRKKIGRPRKQLSAD